MVIFCKWVLKWLRTTMKNKSPLSCLCQTKHEKGLIEILFLQCCIEKYSLQLKDLLPVGTEISIITTTTN